MALPYIYQHPLRVDGGLQGLDDGFAEEMEAGFANVRRRQRQLRALRILGDVATA